MASDEDYMSFLDKANQDPSEGRAKTASSGKREFKTTDSGVQVPAVLQSAVKDAFYVSDADEPFVPVCLKWDEGGNGLPDEGRSPSLSILFLFPGLARQHIQGLLMSLAPLPPRGILTDMKFSP